MYRPCHRPSSILVTAFLGLVIGNARAEEPVDARGRPLPFTPRIPDEPAAETFSLDRAVKYLDGVTVQWLEQRQCASCHTGFPYLLARASVPDDEAPAVLQVRKFFDDRIARWDEGGKGAGYLTKEGRLKDSQGITEVVGIAGALAMHDAATTGKLQPTTRQALGRMWELQRPDGSWNWNRTGLAPMEHDEYFGVVYAAVGVGHAPNDYARSDEAAAGTARLHNYLAKNPAPSLHHRVWLLWAASHLEGLIEPNVRERWIAELRSLQHADGGWSLASLGDWKRRDTLVIDAASAPSDGYATGLVTYVLRRIGIAADDQAIVRGVAWLKSDQRASGRWFTRSPNWDRGHLISNAGTAFAILAITEVERRRPKP